MYLTHTCPKCGKNHEMETTPEPDKLCPECQKKYENNCIVEVFSRVTGFFRPTSVWNPGKQEEFKDRKTYKITKDEDKP